MPSPIKDDVIIEPPGCIRVGRADQQHEIYEIVVGRMTLDFAAINAIAAGSASASVPAITLLQRPNQPANLTWSIYLQQVVNLGNGAIVMAASAGEGVITCTAVNYGTATLSDPAAIEVSYLAFRSKRTLD